MDTDLESKCKKINSPGSYLLKWLLQADSQLQYSLISVMGCLGGSVVRNPPANAEDAGSIPGLGRSLEKEMTTTSVFLPGKSHGLRSLEG